MTGHDDDDAEDEDEVGPIPAGAETAEIARETAVSVNC
jgi:hypothetical protein